MSLVDLHLHTRYSDGSWTPDDLCQAAARLQLAAIAITDHDTVDAVPEMLEAGQRHGVAVLPGAEITCCIGTREIHMLGYLPVDSWNSPELQVVLDHSKRVREKRIGDIVGRVNELGIPLTTADVFACSDCGTVGRPHVAMALMNRGVVKSTGEAFDRFLKRGKPGFVERYRMKASEAIGHIKRAGGIAVLAHPALNRVDEYIAEMVQQGLGGLEIWHSRHTESQTEQYWRLAKQFDLLITGGSDCHGPTRGKPLLGTVRVPYECFAALKERLAQVK